jgi:hypothetical protein
MDGRRSTQDAHFYTHVREGLFFPESLVEPVQLAVLRIRERVREGVGGRGAWASADAVLKEVLQILVGCSYGNLSEMARRQAYAPVSTIGK